MPRKVTISLVLIYIWEVITAFSFRRYLQIALNSITCQASLNKTWLK
jgi:hypothetical protein